MRSSFLVKYKWDRASQFLIYHLEMNFTLSILILEALTQRLLIKIPLKFLKNGFLYAEFSILTKFSSGMVPIFNWLMSNDAMQWKNILRGIIQPYLLFSVPENFHLLMLFWVESQSDYVKLLPFLISTSNRVHFFTSSYFTIILMVQPKISVEDLLKEQNYSTA